VSSRPFSFFCNLDHLSTFVVYSVTQPELFILSSEFLIDIESESNISEDTDSLFEVTLYQTVDIQSRAHNYRAN
jgi:hypothetical protein